MWKPIFTRPLTWWPRRSSSRSANGTANTRRATRKSPRAANGPGRTKACKRVSDHKAWVRHGLAAVLAQQFAKAGQPALLVGPQVVMDMPAQVVGPKIVIVIRSAANDRIERIQPEIAGFAQHAAEG